MGQMRQAVKSTDELQIKLEEHLNHRMEREQQRLMTTALIAMTLAILATVIPALMLGRSILRPINTLAATMKRASDEHDLTLRIASDGKDEVGRMAQDFNSMMDSFPRTDRTGRRNLWATGHGGRTTVRDNPGHLDRT